MRKNNNKLIHEKSPYLLQHAFNPVDWYGWHDEAFQKAKKEDKPIFLSIGYSTCHWCHVMERESFEDEHVAELMNEVFVAIKVDREERPDIDNVYMTVCQMMTGSGGWPLTIIMTPDKKPFFAATYLPKESRFGRMGMMELIPKIQQVWQGQRDKVEQSAKEITAHLKSTSTTSSAELSEKIVQRTFRDLSHRFDEQKGGFSEAPKFPTPHNLLFLMRYYHRTKEKAALAMVEKTLTEMRRGGIFDHLGFGFHRYATDKNWLLPHFEKMLYDQAMLILAYAEAYQLTREEMYAQTVREIITYVLRDMTAADGGFCSAEDADSEGVEGKFYVWTKDEIDAILGKDFDWFCQLYHTSPDGNFSEEATGHRTGANILHRQESLQEFAAAHGWAAAELLSKVEIARQQLFIVRENRIHPHKDDKILTDWNGLMIAALAVAGRVLKESSYIRAAEKAVDFIEKNLIDADGHLLHRYRDGEAGIPAFVDDYAFLIWGLIELHQTTQNHKYLEKAMELNSVFIDRFWDEKNGGFFSTAENGENLLVRQKEIYDGAIPSGNSVTMYNLLRLAKLTGNSSYAEKANRLARAFAGSVNNMPSAYTFLLSAVDFADGPSYEIVIVGEPEAEDTKELLDACHNEYLPHKVVVLKSLEAETPYLTQIAEFVKDYDSLDGKATAYVCQNFSCQLPTTDKHHMLKLLGVHA